MNRIPTRLHGVLDYLTVATFLTVPRVMGWNRNSTRLLTNAACGTLLYSLLTRYELGAVRVLPMKGHLTLDATSGALLCIAPLLDLEERREVLAALVGFGLFELAVTMTSETRSPLEPAE